ncbi:MAG: M1 family metallopeptidase [Pseudomonadota bacterium]
MTIPIPRKLLCAAALAIGSLALQGALLAQALVIAVPEPYTDTGIPFAPAHGALVTTPSAPNAWGGPRSGAEATLSDQVASYEIDAKLDPVRHTIAAKQKLHWRNRSARPVRAVYLHLYLNAFEHANTTFFTEQRQRGGGPAFGGDAKEEDWGHITLQDVRQRASKVDWSFVQPDDGPATDHTVVRFDLPEAVAPGATTTIDIAFNTKLPRVVARSGYFGSFHLAGQWFPKIGVLELPGERGATAPRWNVHEYHADSEFYADFGHYDVRLTVPKGYTVGATGQLQGSPVEKDGMVTHHYAQGDVHDFAWTADRRYAAPLTGTWSGAGGAQVDIRVLYAPEYAASAAPSLKAAQDALAYYGKTLGPYPYKTLTIVLPPHNADAAGGMEYPTFYTADSYTAVQPDTRDAFELDMVNIHEFGHGYFYGILASNEFEEPLLDEGLNEYWTLRMARERGRQIHVAPGWLQQLGIAPAFDVFQFERGGTPRENPADPLARNAYDRLQGIGPVYRRGALVMHDLEAQLGKEATERAFQEYYRRWRFRHPSVADLRETLAEASGQRKLVEQVFAQQVYKTEKIDDRVSAISSEEVLPQPGSRLVDGKRVTLTQAQVDQQIDALREQWRKAHPGATAGGKAVANTGTGAGSGTIDTAATGAGTGAKTSGKVLAGAPGGPFPFRTEVIVQRRGAAVPQTLLVRFADGSSETVQWPVDERGERWQRHVWIKPVKAVSAELDPEHHHLLDTSKLDDSRTIQADRSATRRWTFDAAAFIQLALTLIASI